MTAEHRVAAGAVDHHLRRDLREFTIDRNPNSGGVSVVIEQHLANGSGLKDPGTQTLCMLKEYLIEASSFNVIRVVLVYALLWKFGEADRKFAPPFCWMPGSSVVIRSLSVVSVM